MPKKKNKKLVEQIKEVEDKGFKVKIEHHRKLDKDNNVAPKGGFTSVDIMKDDAVYFRASALVHPEDNYNKKLGAIIALGRARKELNNANPYLFS